MEHENVTTNFESTPEQLKAAQRQIAKTIAIRVAVRIGVAVAASLAAKAILKSLEKKETDSSTTNP